MRGGEREGDGRGGVMGEGGLADSEGGEGGVEGEGAGEGRGGRGRDVASLPGLFAGVVACGCGGCVRTQTHVHTHIYDTHTHTHVRTHIYGTYTHTRTYAYV